MVFSPLYTVFFAWIQRLFFDAGAATAAHRFLIIAGGAFATLAAARRMLPPAWAWLVALWWLLLHRGAFFEVHLFGYAMVALGAACVGAGRSAWWRGGALALLAADAVLVRNELLPAAALFALVCLAEVWRPGLPAQDRPHRTAALLIPSVLAALLALWLFSGSREQLSLHRLRERFQARNQANFQQVYPFGYMQRHTDWQGDPWIEGGTLLQRDFGNPTASMAQALRANPRAFLEHVWWNARLTPAGLQEGLLGGYTGSYPPEFMVRRPEGVSDPRLLSVGVVLLWGAGGWLLLEWWRRHGRFFRRGSPARWPWLYLLCTVPTALLSIATQRPRPSYIFPLIFLLMVCTALSARLLLGWLRRRVRLPAVWGRRVPAGAGAAALLLLPRPATARATVHAPWLLDDYHRLDDLRATTTREHRVLCTDTDSATELVYYLNRGREYWQVVPWRAVSGAATAAEFEAALVKAGATDLYFRHDTGTLSFLPKDGSSLALGGDWLQVALVCDPAGRWEYWSRRADAPAPVKEKP